MSPKEDINLLLTVRKMGVPRQIWMYWHAGASALPPECRLCVDTYRKHNPEWSLTIVGDDTMATYIGDDLANLILTSGLRVSHKSDILRIELLAQHGGIWADMTTICTESLVWLDSYPDTQLFVFSRDSLPEISSWWLACPEGSHPVKMWRDEFLRIIEANEWKAIDEYFVFHSTFKSLYKNPVFSSMCLDCPVLDAAEAHVLQHELNNPLTDRFRQVVAKGLCNKIYKLKGRSQGSIDLSEGTGATHLFSSILRIENYAATPTQSRWPAITIITLLALTSGYILLSLHGLWLMVS